MACDAAFRIIAQRALAQLAANHAATRAGDTVALHQMRIALTQLRTAIVFFSPMVEDAQRQPIRAELKWLNGHLGCARDIDVAMERLGDVDFEQPAAGDHHAWRVKHRDIHRQLARALGSARYRRLIQQTADWIDHGPWSTKPDKRAKRERGAPVIDYSTAKLAQWQAKLLSKSGKLAKLDTVQRHRLRLLTKKLTYSIAAFEDLLTDRRFRDLLEDLKYLRKAQKCLGQLNDAANGRALAAALRHDGVPAPLSFLGPKAEKRLLHNASRAYRKLTARRSFAS